MGKIKHNVLVYKECIKKTVLAHGGRRLGAELEQVLERGQSLSALTVVNNDCAGAGHDADGVALGVELAETSHLAELLVFGHGHL